MKALSAPSLATLLAALIALSPLCGHAAHPREIRTVITAINGFGSAATTLTPADFQAAGYAYGDVFTITLHGITYGYVPYYTGYYADSGHLELVCYNGKGDVHVALGERSFADRYSAAVGDSIVITPVLKGAERMRQSVLGLIYSDDRTQFPTPQAFANFREVRAGQIQAGRLYRSASPFDNSHSRAATSSQLAEEAGIRTILDLSDDLPHMERHKPLPPYSQQMIDGQHVICHKLGADITSEKYYKPLIQMLTSLAAEPTPYLVHCVEGKDRTGYACFLLEALAGATYAEIEADYMQTYANYFGITRQGTPDKYETIVRLRLLPFLRNVASTPDATDLTTIDLQAAVAAYLVQKGMPATAVETLRTRLTHQNSEQ